MRIHGGGADSEVAGTTAVEGSVAREVAEAAGPLAGVDDARCQNSNINNNVGTAMRTARRARIQIHSMGTVVSRIMARRTQDCLSLANPSSSLRNRMILWRSRFDGLPSVACPCHGCWAALGRRPEIEFACKPHKHRVLSPNCRVSL